MQNCVKLSRDGLETKLKAQRFIFAIQRHMPVFISMKD